MAELLSVADLEAAKKQDTFHSEVITGKTGGVAGGADIDYATNTVTGQVQKTLPKLLSDIDWSYVGDFDDGVEFTKRSDFAVDSVGIQWVYVGSYPFTATAGTVPSDPLYQVVHVSDHNQTTNRNAIGAHIASAISRGSSDVDADFTRIENKGVKRCAQYANEIAAGAAPVMHFYGDSTMWGATIGNLGAQDPNNAPASFVVAMGLLYTATITTSNKAISGTTLRGMISGTDGSGSTFASKVNPGGISNGAGVIFCNHGINDSQLNLDINQYKQDLYDFIDLCRNNGKTPVLVTPNPNPIYDIIDEAKSKRLYEFVKVMRSVVDQVDCDLVDQYYYFTKTTKSIRIVDIVPDGAHLSSRAYLQAGFNLAIPFISARTIGDTGDVAGLANVSWIDNGTLNRNLYSVGNLDRETRCGSTLSFDRTAGIVGLSYPVIMDEPLKSVSVIGLQWTSGANMDMKINNVVAGTQFYQAREYGNKTVLDWDAENKVHYPFWAGLNVMSFYFDNVNQSVGEGFAFSGLYVPPLKFSGKTSDSPSYLDTPSIGTFDTVIADVDFYEGLGLTLVDKTGSPCLKVVSLSGKIYMQTWANGSAVLSQELSASTIADGNYPVRLSISYESITVKVSGIGTTITINEPVTDMRVGNEWLSYHVRPTVNV